jgi:hypothetical protein
LDGPAWRSVAILMVTMAMLWLLVDQWYDAATPPPAPAKAGAQRQ